jgi:DNA gyrase subunit A
MLEELGEVVSKYSDERRTVLLDDDEAELEMPQVVGQIADEDVVVTLSHEGFVKRIPMHLYKRRVGSGKALAGMERYEDDYLERIFVARTQGWILAFTEGGHCNFLPVLDLPESGRASRGQSIYALLDGADRSDRIISMIPIDDLKVEGRYLVFLSRQGIMKRTLVTEFSNPRSGGVKAAGVKDGDGIMDVSLSDGTTEIMLLSRKGRAIRFPENDVSVVGRTAAGVRGMALKGDDRVAGMLLIRRNATVLTISEDGLGKRTEISEFPLQKRGGQGNLAMPSGDQNAPIVCALEVVEADEVMIVTAGGQVTRAAADSVPIQGRRSQGKRITAVDGGDRVVEVTRAQGRGGAPAGEPIPSVNDTAVDTAVDEPGVKGGQLDLLGE